MNIIKEGPQGSLYHYTTIDRILNILKTNTFNLSSNLGTKADEFGKKFFFLSTTRTPSPAIGYGENKSARLTLDITKLKNNHQIISSDYWEGKNPEKVTGFGSQNPQDKANWEWLMKKNAELEDRIISNKPTITNALNYIEQVDLIMYGGHINTIIEIANICKNNNILVNIYPTNKDFINKKNKMDINLLKNNPDGETENYKNDDYDPFYNYENLFAIILYDKKYTNDYKIFEPVFNDFCKKHNLENLNLSTYKVYDIMRNLGYTNDDTLRGLKSNLHNFFKGGGNSRIRELITLLTTKMSKVGVRNIEDYVNLVVNGIKPNYFQKYDYSKKIKIVRLEDNYIVPNDTKLKSGHPSIFLRSDSRYITKNDYNKFLELYENEDTVSKLLNYLFNSYDENIAKKKFEHGTYDWDNKQQYKLS